MCKGIIQEVQTFDYKPFLDVNPLGMDIYDFFSISFENRIEMS